MSTDSENLWRINIWAADMSEAQFEALFERVSEVAHALDEQVVCSGGLEEPDDSPVGKAGDHVTADLADELAAVDVLHFDCDACDRGEHDRPTLHAEAALQWVRDRLDEQIIAQAITRGTHYQRRADQTYRQAQARAVIAALAAYLGATP